MRLATLIVMLPLAGCGVDADRTISVETPGMPSAELALVKSMDRVHGFLTELDDRLGSPAKAVVPGPEYVRADTPRLGSPAVAAVAPATVKPPRRAIRAEPPAAEPVRGRDGVTYFAYAGGRPHITCVPGAVCGIQLERGETVTADRISLPPGSGWTAEVAPFGGAEGEVITFKSATGADRSVVSIETDRRSYSIALEPAGGPSLLLSRFTYRTDDPGTQVAAAGDQSLGAPDFAYRLLGATPSWRPVRVYADGGQTFIQFPVGQATDGPRLVVPASKGGLTPIAYRIVADSYVVDGVLDQALLIPRAGPSSDQILIRHDKAA